MRLPKEHAIWIAAPKLEEANGNTGGVGKLIEQGILALQGEGVNVNRDVWMKEAKSAERAGYLETLDQTLGTFGYHYISLNFSLGMMRNGRMYCR